MTDAAANFRDSLRGITVLDRYRIGGFELQEPFGDTFHGARIADDTPVTIKLAAYGEIRNDEDLIECLALLDELVGFSHPHVEQLVEHGIATVRGSEALCLIYEHTTGETLQSRLSAVSRLSVFDAWRVALRVAEALAVGHRFGIIHGELRAGNVVLTSPDADGNPRVKLRNYGTSRAISPLGRESPALRQLHGSALSMAPEQILGEPVEPATDVYAFGTVFYRMLTGATPFPADNTSKVMQGHLKGLITPLREAAPDAGIPEVFDGIIARCLARSPKQRFTDGGALLLALADCQAAVLAAAAKAPARSALESSSRSVAPPARPSSAPRPTAPPLPNPDMSQRVSALGRPPGERASEAPPASGKTPVSSRPRAPSQPRLAVPPEVRDESVSPSKSSRPSSESSRSSKLPADVSAPRGSSTQPSSATSSPSPSSSSPSPSPSPSPAATSAALAEARAAVVRGAIVLFAAALAGALCMTMLAWLIGWRSTQTALLAELQRSRSLTQTTSALRPSPVRLVIRTNARNAKAWVRGREYPAPIELELAAGTELERVEVVAQGHITRREWVTFNHAVTLAFDLEPEAPAATVPAAAPVVADERPSRFRAGRQRLRPPVRGPRRNDGRGVSPGAAP